MRQNRLAAVLTSLLVGVILLGLGAVVALFVLGVRTERYASPAPLEPLPTPIAPTELTEIRLDSTFVSEPRTFTTETAFTEVILLGEDADGTPTVYINYTEEGLNEYAYYWYADDFLANDDRIRNAAIDIREGAVVLQAEVNLAVNWQPVELVFVVDESGTQLRFDGVQIGGTYFVTAPDTYLADRAAFLEEQVNSGLTSLRLLDVVEGEQLAITAIRLMEDEAVVIAAPITPED